MLGLEHAGSGRYIQNLVRELNKIDRQNEYVLFVRRNTPLDGISSNNVKFIISEAHHYSLKEQVLLPYLIHRQKIDLMHFPQFNVPILYFGNYVVTIHDLIKNYSRGTATTTRNPLFYWLKYLGYLLVFWFAVKKAKKIIVPSKTVALQLEKAYKINPKKVKVTYEGIENKLLESNKINEEKITQKYSLDEPFLLYVGSVYPHKNIDNLIKAVKKTRIRLLVVCARSVFWERLKKQIKNLKAEKLVELLGFVPDEDLAVLYKKARAFVFPSLAEGFGLPGLEAMAAGLPVLASNIPVFKEVYQDGALYFNPQDPEDMATKIKQLLRDRQLEIKLKNKGLEISQKYSWEKMAKETLNLYLNFDKV